MSPLWSFFVSIEFHYLKAELWFLFDAIPQLECLSCQRLWPFESSHKNVTRAQNGQDLSDRLQFKKYVTL